ncbi:MAG TPA: hypothetical protein DCQ57_05610, partial [Enterobacteriaceae bacterium]|nr:hypothetical protein [Enterobacteriaceae bacterium]
RRALLPSITLADVLKYREQLKANARPEFLMVGNISPQQATELAQQARTQLGTQGKTWPRNQDVVVDNKQQAIFNKAGSSTDSAL